MTATELRHRLIERINNLSDERLHVADDFLAYLEERESNEATEELLAMPGFLEDFQEAREDIRFGRLTPVEQLHHKSP